MKRFVFSTTMLLGVIFSARAVSIDWYMDADEQDSAALVYMAAGESITADSFDENGQLVALTSPSVVLSTDDTASYTGALPSETVGSYYMVLFRSGENGPEAAWANVAATDIKKYDDDQRSINNDVSQLVFENMSDIQNWTAVPEPTAVALFLLGLGGVALRRKGGVA